MKAFTTQVNPPPGGPFGEPETFDAQEANSLMQEGKNFVESAGLVADASGASNPDPNTFQMGQAANRYTHKGNYYTDTGVANAYVLSLTGYRSVGAYLDGMSGRVVVQNANTGASTINISGLGIKSLTLEGGAALPAGYVTPANETHFRYNATADRVEVIRATGTLAVATPSILQTVYAETTANVPLTANIPADDTIPQITEGTQVLSATITPTSAASKIRLRFQAFGANSTNFEYITAAAFRGAVTNAIAAATTWPNTNSNPFPVVLEVQDSPATTSAVTYSIRIGPQNGNTIRINGNQSGRLFGGAARATLVLEEVQ